MDSMEALFDEVSGAANNQGAISDPSKFIKGGEGHEEVTKEEVTKEKRQEETKSSLSTTDTLKEEMTSYITNQIKKVTREKGGNLSAEHPLREVFKKNAKEAIANYASSILAYIDSNPTAKVEVLKPRLIKSIDSGVADYSRLLTTLLSEEEKKERGEVSTPSDPTKEEEVKADKVDGLDETDRAYSPIRKKKVGRSDTIFNEDDVAQIISVLDLYRGYDHKVQSSIRAFFAVEAEVDVVTSVLNENMNTQQALGVLIEAHGKNQVDRAFFLMGLSDNLVTHVGKLITTYTGADSFRAPANSANKINFCRDLEAMINSLTEEQSRHLKAIHELLETTK